MAQFQLTSAEDQIRFDGLRVIRLTALSFLFVAALSVYGPSTESADPASATATVPSLSSQTLTQAP